MKEFINAVGSSFGFEAITPTIYWMILIGFIILSVWTLVWKALALWRAARRGEKIWFVVFLVVNTAGILEIMYLVFVTRAKMSDFTGSSSPSNTQS